MTGEQAQQAITAETENNNCYRCSSEHLLDECRRMGLVLNRATKKRLKKRPLSDGLINNLFISDEDVRNIVEDLAEKDRTSADPEIHEIENEYALLSAKIEEKKRISAAKGVFLGLPALQEIFRLTCFETDVMVLAMLPELKKSYERVLGYLQDDITAKRPTIGLIAELFSNSEEQRTEVVRYFLGDNALSHFDILKFSDFGDQTAPLSSRPLRIDDRIINYALGSGEIDGALSKMASLRRPEGCVEMYRIDKQLQEKLVVAIRRHLKEDSKSQKLFINFTGPYGSGREALFASLCRDLSVQCLVVDMEQMAGSESSLEPIIRKVFREGILQPAAVYFKNIDVLFTDEEKAKAWRHIFFSVAQELSWITCFSGKLDTLCKEPVMRNNKLVNVELLVPGIAERKQIWLSLLKESGTNLADDEINSLANTYRFTAGQISDTIGVATNITHQGNSNASKRTVDVLQESCRSQSHHKLATLAQKVRCPNSWDDLVLPAARKERLREISNFIKYREVVYVQWGFGRKLTLGRGLNILFTGPSGTGKTMAAGILANEFGHELYKIDLSSVVSKYIGETEKNISKIFAEAATSNAMLFFDEADALFGKRSEIKDAHDRYANIEVNYLLQKMEEHEGIVILATNLSKNMDDAFLRRMHFTVEFPFPDEQQRYLIWKQMYPEQAPLANNIDYHFLAERMKLPGGNIKNVAVASAFYAAEQKAEVAMSHVMLAAEREYKKIGKSFLRSDFEPYYDLIAEAS
jgi:DNA replication protein DnaC